MHVIDLIPEVITCEEPQILDETTNECTNPVIEPTPDLQQKNNSRCCS